MKTIVFLLACFVFMSNDAFAQEPNSTLQWDIKASKDAFYPGEPLLLIIDINNIGKQEEEVNFGADGIGAFSFEIQDSNVITLSKKGKIIKHGFSTRDPHLKIEPNKVNQKLIVLNRWCSTLLPPGQYHVICNIEYWLRSEGRKLPNNGFEFDKINTMQLKLDIKIIQMDQNKYKDILEPLALPEIRPKNVNRREWIEWLDHQDFKAEMLAFAESDLAVPYQLQVLRTKPYNRFGRDTVNSLVKSGTLEAANGLVQIIEETSFVDENYKNYIVNGVYRLRDTKKADILSATEKIASKHKRPIICEPLD